MQRAYGWLSSRRLSLLQPAFNRMMTCMIDFPDSDRRLGFLSNPIIAQSAPRSTRKATTPQPPPPPVL